MHRAQPRCYQLFGLRVTSDLELPEALPDRAPEVAAPDIVIRLGPIDMPPTPPGIAVVGGGLLLTVPDVGRYQIREGREILIDVEADVPDKNVRLYLLGSAVGAALHQRGLLPLHANAVEIDGSAVAFVGESGAGKSTLAGWFHDRGHRVLSDDVCVVHDAGAGRPLVYPAVRRLRLCRDALLASGRAPGEHDSSYSGDPDFDKFDVPLPHDVDAPMELAAVVLLEFGSTDCIRRLNGTDAADILFRHTYRGGMVGQVGNAALHWRAVVRMLPKVKVFQWIRRRERAALDDGVGQLIETLRVAAGDNDQTLGSQIA